MNLPPKKGAIYVATKFDSGKRFFIEDIFDAEDEDGAEGEDGFFLVTIVEEANKGDMSAMALELDPDEWRSFVDEHGLVGETSI
jgi:hypothetical protein